MSKSIESQRLVANVAAYVSVVSTTQATDNKAAEKRTIADAAVKTAAKPAKLPNDAKRANHAIRTRERRYGPSKTTAQGKANLSKKKK